MTSARCNRHWLEQAAALVVTCCAASTAPGGDIRVWPTAVVTSDTILLGDVASVRGLDRTLVEQLSALVVRDAPRPGGELLVRTADLREALDRFGVNLGELSFRGSSRCKVSRPRPIPVRKTKPARATKKVLTRKPKPKKKPQQVRTAREPAATNTLEAALRRYIAARIPRDEGRIQVRFGARSDGALSLRDDEYRFVIHPALSGGARRSLLGHLSFRVDLFKDDVLVRTLPIVAEALLYREVVVARKAINRGQTIEAGLLRIEERGFDDLSKIGLTRLETALGNEARRFVRPGQMLTQGAIAPKPIVRRGDAVTIWRRGGGLRIKTTGKAMDPGFLGSTIRVRRNGTKRAGDLIDVVVTGPGTVEISDARRVAASTLGVQG